MSNTISLAAAEKALRPKLSPQPAPADLVTEDSAAMRFASIYRSRLLYCHDRGSWFEWTGNAWRPNKIGLAFNWARELARELAEREPDKVRYVTSRTAFAKGVETFARHDPVFAVTAERWDRDHWLLGTPGGTVDLRTGKLRPSDPQDGITKLTAIAPSERVDCPRWLAFLKETTGGDTGLIRFIHQWSGHCLTGDTREHALIFVYGGGGNGKSVFLNTVSGIALDYAVTAAMDTFTASTSDKHPTDLAMLQGARIVTASETEEGRAWAEARIKQMTGGDPITARFMNKDFFTFRPQFKLTIVGNHQPVLRNVDEASRRRFNIVPFTRKPAVPDPRLEASLREEWPGILRWMIEGCLDWQQNGLIRPASVVDATAEYFAEQDTFGQWLADECDCEPGNRYKRETTADLISSWHDYAKRMGEIPTAGKTFADEMQKRDFAKVRTSGARGFEGVRLKRPAHWNAGE